MWLALGHDSDDGFRIDGVTGPDEYSALGDNNVFTNLMAQRNLTAAADACLRITEQARLLLVSGPEVEAWRRGRPAIVIPWDGELQLHPQGEGFTRHERWDFAGTQPTDTRCFCTFRISTSTASKWSSKRTSYWRCSCAPMLSPPSRNTEISITTRN